MRPIRHADPAAVNINLWLTDDAACIAGWPLEQKGIHHKTGAKGVREGVIVCGAVWWM